MSNQVPQIRFNGYSDAWVQRKLSDVMTFLNGRAYKQPELLDSGKYPVLRVGNFGTNEQWYYSDLELNEKFYANDGDLLYTWATAFGPHIWRGDKVIYHYHIWKLDLSEVIHRDFAVQVLEYDKAKLLANTNGSTMIHVTKGEMEKKEIAIPSTDEQDKIGDLFTKLDSLIAANQHKLDLLKEQKKGYLQKMFPKKGAKVPELRFAGFADDWEERKLGDEFKKVSERNDGSFGRNHWISVAKMYFQSPEKVQSNNIDTRTYVMREGDIAFEGHPNSEFKFGRFVANDIGAGVVSELFPIYRHQHEYDNNYWKNAIQIERTMAPIFAKSITSSGNSSNKLDTKHFLRQKILIPQINEQKKIGSFFKQLDDTIDLHQRKLELVLMLVSWSGF